MSSFPANISNEKAEQLLTKCGDNIIDASKTSRNELCQGIYKNLLKHDKVDLNILHAYINVCVENGIKLDIKEFLTNIKYKATGETYKLLLRNVSETGDIDEVFKILELMKIESIPINEAIFNDLVLAHSISG